MLDVALGAPTAGPSLLEQVEECARRRPGVVAVTAGGRSLTYGELRAQAGRLAAVLRGRGVGAESLVGVCVERSVGLVVAVLGIWKAGAAYLPIDPSHPAARTRLLAEDSRLTTVVIDERLVPAWPDVRGCALVSLDHALAAGDGAEWAPLRPPGDAELAYVIYTSGSTGNPKGVAMTHGPLRNLIRWQQHSSAVTLARAVAVGAVSPDASGAGKATLQYTPMTFDVSFLEIFSTLSVGGTVVIPSERERADASVLLDVLVTHRIGSVFLPLVALNQLAEVGVRRGIFPGSLFEIMTGGEQLRITPAIAAWLRGMPGCTLQNIYGPTEAHVVTTHDLHGDPAAWPVLAPIGRPIFDVDIHVLDETLRAVADGEIGEIYIGGPCLARGYLHQPELTSARFVDGPPGAGRLYRTGDLAHRLPDGALMYDGRTDDQVKIHGVRVELGEIESVLQRHPAVSACAVLAQPDVCGGKRLVAYVVPRVDGQEPPESVATEPVTRQMDPRWLGFLAKQLPETLVPRTYVTLPALPVTSSGKVDRKALPAPSTRRPELGGPAVRPSTATEGLLAAIWQELLQLDEVGIDDNFFELGGQSLLVVQMQSRIAARLQREIPAVAVFQSPTVRALAASIDGAPLPSPSARTSPSEKADRAVSRSARESDIAIIGMSLRFPGAGDRATFWENLRQGVESIVFFSEQECAAANPRHGRKANLVRAGAVLSDIDCFDAAFFGYGAREAEAMDPQQRVFLECAWEAFEAAGYVPGASSGPVGVYAGCGINTYLINNVHPGRGFSTSRSFLESADDLQVMIGNEKEFLSTRVSYKLNLRGPSIAVQSACSTSLVAVHLACQSLLGGECDMALAGSSTIRVPQAGGYLHEEGMVFSPDGHTRAFDAGAQGTTFGSGVAAVLLKRLGDAIADGDAIHAVIRGSAVNNDGAGKVGFTAPSVRGQAEVVRQALRAAGVPSESVSYVEAHGTATPMGDPIEVTALAQAFGDAPREAPCAIGTVKSNFGHLSWSAGMAGLLKTALALEARLLPPSLHFERANPGIDFARTPFAVNTELREWPAGPTPRRAGVSAFGLGGTNAHLVLEEAPALPRAEDALARPHHVLALSAKSGEALLELAARHRAWLEAHPGADLGDVAFTAATGRMHFAHRLAIVASSTADAATQLGALGDPSSPVPPPRVHEVTPGSKKVAFLFTGQGSQYEGMARGLYETQPTFRRELDRCDGVLRAEWGVSLLDVLWPADGAPKRLDDIAYTQGAMFAVEHALARLWMSWGVEPSVVMGHSTGEYVAACIAGVFGLEDGLRLSVARGRLFARWVPPVGAMATVFAAEEEVARRMAPLSGCVSIAAVNGPLSTVISGEASRVREACALLAADGVATKDLRVQRAGHSPLTEPVLEPLREALARVGFAAPRIPIVSNLTGELADASIATPDYWCRHTRETVRFAAGVQTLLGTGADAFLEIGPEPALVGMAAFCAMGSPRTWVPSLRRPRVAGPHEDVQNLLLAVARLHVEGVAVDWRAFDADYTRRRVHLPTYPFRRTRFWIDARTELAAPEAAAIASRPEAPTRVPSDALLRVEWRPQALAPRALAATAERRAWLILADETGVGEALAASLTGAGHTCTVARAPGSSRPADAVVAPGDGEAMARLVASDPSRGVVYLWALDAPRAGALAGETAALDGAWGACEGLLHLAQAVAGTGAPARMWVVTRDAQPAGPADRVEGLAQSPVWAMARVIGMEHPELRCARVDLGAPSASDIGALIAELGSDGAHDAVALRAGERRVARLAPAGDGTVPLPCAPVVLREDGAYLVTGGVRGVGLHAARWLVARGARYVLLAARRPPDAAGEAVLAEMRGAGARVEVVTADVSKRSDVERIFDAAEASRRPLLGIVHSAGVLADGVVLQHTGDRFREVLLPKVQGGWNLHAAACERAPALEHFVLFSSAASLLGNAGQANHAAANAFLDALAHHRRAAGLPATSVNWGAWGEVGELVRNQAARGRLERLGFGVIGTEQGLDALGRAMASGTAQLGVSPMVWATFLRECHLQDVPFYAAFAARERLARAPSLRAQLAAAAPDARHALLVARVRAEIAHVLGAPPAGGIDGARPLAEYGLDSLSSIELRNRLQAAMELPLPPMLVFKHPTVDAIVALLGSLSPEDAPESPAAHVDESPAPDDARPLSMQQARWLRLIRAGYGQRVVPIVFQARLDRAVFRAALTRVVERHELLRQAYPGDAVRVLEARQVISSDEDLFTDLRGLGDEAREAGLAAAVRACWEAMPDPSERPSWAVRCVDLPRDRFLLLLSLQHLDFDGSSLTAFVDELREAYRAGLAGEAPALPPAVQYVDYARAQRKYMQGPIAEHRAFFEGLYASLQRTTSLPGHQGYARTVAHPSGRHTPAVERGLWRRLQQRAALLGVTPFALLFAAYAQLVAEIAGEGDVVIAMIVNGRADAQFQRTIGPFTAPFPVKIGTAGASLDDLARQCHRVVAAINARSSYPVSDLSDHIPAFAGFPMESYFTDVGINFTNYRREERRGGIEARVLEVLGPIADPEFAAANTPELRRIPGLHLVLDLVDDEIRMNFWYHLHRFSEAQVAGWAARYLQIHRGARAVAGGGERPSSAALSESPS